MTNKLEEIILQKKSEVAALHTLIRHEPEHMISKMMNGKLKRTATKSFKKALRSKNLAIIAEIKRKSPSKGHLAEITDPASLAQQYVTGGANALSILTDSLFFGGHLSDLSKVAHVLKEYPQPILRKDFIIDKIQIAEAIYAGADAILGIVAILQEKIKSVLSYAKELGIEVLVEVHNLQELEIALESGAEIIGVNNRDLCTFQIDTSHAFKLVESIPKEIIRVAESGILVPELAQEYYHAGFDAVLIGEALVKTNQPEHFIKACRYA